MANSVLRLFRLMQSYWSSKNTKLYSQQEAGHIWVHSIAFWWGLSSLIVSSSCQHKIECQVKGTKRTNISVRRLRLTTQMVAEMLTIVNSCRVRQFSQMSRWVTIFWSLKHLKGSTLAITGHPQQTLWATLDHPLPRCDRITNRTIRGFTTKRWKFKLLSRTICRSKNSLRDRCLPTSATKARLTLVRVTRQPALQISQSVVYPTFK